MDFYFLYFFYASNNKTALFYIQSELLFVIRAFDFFFHIIKFIQHIIKTNSSRLLTGSIKALEIKTSIQPARSVPGTSPDDPVKVLRS